jgi:hypothetical protein
MTYPAGHEFMDRPIGCIMTTNDSEICRIQLTGEGRWVSLSLQEALNDPDDWVRDAATEAIAAIEKSSQYSEG